MTTRSVVHADFTVERTFEAPLSRVYAAFADPQAKAKWFGGPPGSPPADVAMDFRIGGREHHYGAFEEGGTVHRFDAVYMDIVENERIVYTYDMRTDEARISVSMATLTFEATGSGTRFTLTEQGVFLDGQDTAAQREEGTRWLLDGVAASLSEASVPSGA